MSKVLIKVMVSNEFVRHYGTSELDFNVDVEKSSDLIRHIVKEVFEKNLRLCKTRSEALYNTSALLGMSERNIQRIVYGS